MVPVDKCSHLHILHVEERDSHAAEEMKQVIGLGICNGATDQELTYICSPVGVQLHDQRAMLQGILLRPADGLWMSNADVKCSGKFAPFPDKVRYAT